MSEELNRPPSGEKQPSSEESLKNVEGNLSPEEQIARQKVVEFLNERQRKAVEAKEAGKKGDYDIVIARYEALREAAQSGEFDKAVSAPSTSGVEISTVREYLNKFLDSASTNLVERGKEVYGGDETQKDRLTKARELFERIDEVVSALDNAKPEQRESRQAENKVLAQDDENKKEPAKQEDESEPPEPPGDGVENQDQYEPDDSWLDPRRIQELKGKYEDSIERERRSHVFTKADQEVIRMIGEPGEERPKRELINRVVMKDDSILSEHYKNILKTHLIESEIRRVIKNAELAQRKYGIGKVPGEPSEEIKRRMAEMMDDENLEAKAAEADHHRFRIGQEVKFAHLGGKIETGWRVKSFIDKFPSEVTVRLEKEGHPDRFESQEELLRMQTLEEGTQNAAELLRGYFNQPVKVRLPSGEVVVQRFGGVSLNGEAIVDYNVTQTDEQGNETTRTEKYRVSPKEFISWQSLPPAEEAARQAAEEQAQRGEEEEKADDGGGSEEPKNGSDTPADTDTSAEDSGTTESEDDAEDQAAKDDGEATAPPRPKTEQQLKVEAMQRKLAQLRAKEVSKSIMERTMARWSNYWKKFDEGETNKERKANKRKKKITIGVGAVGATVLFPVPLWGVALAPLGIAEHQTRRISRWNLQRRINKLEEKIKDEQEEMSVKEAKAS